MSRRWRYVLVGTAASVLLVLIAVRVSPHGRPRKQAIPYDIPAFRAMQLQPGEDWLVIRNCETSSASYLTLASGASPHVEMLTNVTGSIPDDELAQWFVDEDGLFTTGHNRFLLVGTLGAKHGGGEYEFHVRRWEIIAPVDRGTTLWNWLSPRSCLTDGDFR